MCISPNSVWVQRGPKWEQQPVACRQCWRCKQNRVNDYVARAMAEASTSKASCTISLTYAPRDDLADKVLHPRHFQLFMKLLRRAGHKVRYLVAGEYGDLKGRAHFHAILFFSDFADGNGPVPFYNDRHLEAPELSGAFCREIPQKRMVHIREWPHGHISCDWSASEQSARYVCKYLLADNKNNAWFSLSKKPALGAAWFAQRAALARDLDVLPSSFEYLPPGGSRDKKYLMTGATRRDYLNAITVDRGIGKSDLWGRDAMRLRMSEWVQKTFDKHSTLRHKAVAEQWALDNPEEYFVAVEERISDRRLDIDKIMRDLRYEDFIAEHGDLSFDHWLAKKWGFDNVYAFEKWAQSRADAGTNLDGSPRCTRTKPWAEYDPSCKCRSCAGRKPPASDLPRA